MRITKELVANARKSLLEKGWFSLDTSNLIKNIKFTGNDTFCRCKGRVFANPIQYVAGTFQAAPKSVLNYTRKLESLLVKALPEEQIVADYIDCRVETLRYMKNRHSTKYWHKDGGHIRTICCMAGKTTLFRLDGKVYKLGFGETMIFTGMNRETYFKKKIPATVHSGPNGNKVERKLMVGMFIREKS